MAKNKISDFKYTPQNGWLDRTAFPTYYSDENHVRSTFQKLFDQIRDYINGTFSSSLSSEVKNQEGASLIGMSKLFDGDTSGASVADKLLLLRSEIEKTANMDIPDNSLTASKLQNGAVDTEKLADGAITTEKLSTDVLYTINSASEVSTDSSYNFAGMMIGLEQASVDTSAFPKRKFIYDSFKDTSKTDEENSFLTSDTFSIKPRQPESVKPYDSSTSAKDLELSNCELCMIISPDRDNMVLKGIGFNVKTLSSSGVTFRLLVKNVLYGEPGDTILAQSETQNAVGDSNTLTLTSPLTLTKGENYALSIEIAHTTAYEAFAMITSHTLSGGIFVSAHKGTTEDGVTTWTESKFPQTINLNVNWLEPAVYVSIPQEIKENVKNASLFLRKTSGMTAEPKIALYKSGTSPAFLSMTKDASYISSDFENQIVEEKWDFASTEAGDTAQIKLLFSSNYDTSQYISAYCVTFR